MGKAVVSKKRKASVPESGAEKVEVKKVAVDVAAPPEKKRKTAEEVTPVTVKKTKTVKTTTTIEVPAEAPKKASKKEKAAKPVEVEVKEAEQKEDYVESVNEDYTNDVLKGLGVNGEGDDDVEMEDAVETGRPVPELPAGKLSKKDKAKLKAAAEAKESEKPGIVYVGHIPHGFYEHEMREYFTQFGHILQLRLSRNPKTGRSKHYAFIQFDSSSVAQIVAKTMDNYLLFNHILKVKFIPDGQAHEELFKGANRRFTKVPRNKLQGRILEQGASESAWEARKEKEEKKRAARAEKLKAIGYEFEDPKLKSAVGVAKPKPAVEAVVPVVEAEAEKPVEEVPAAVEPEKPTKKAKKSKKTSEPAVVPEAVAPVVEVIAEAVAEAVVEKITAAEPAKAKTKKDKKAKTQAEPIPAVTEPVVEESKSKKRKAKKEVESVAIAATAEESKPRKKKAKKA